MSGQTPELVKESITAPQNDVPAERRRQKNSSKPSAAAQDQANLRSKKNTAPPIPPRTPLPQPKASFTILISSEFRSNAPSDQPSTFLPRPGKLVFTRAKAPSWNHISGTSSDTLDPERVDEIVIETPGALCGASRGIMRHLTRDMVAIAKGVEWIHIPFEDL
jgi:hypothetical protein